MKRLLFSTIMSIILLFQGTFFGALSNDPNFLKVISEQVSKRKNGGVFNFSFKSSIDGSVQPLLVKIPKGYDSTKKWPLLVVLHGLGDGPIIVPSIESMVQIGPYGRGDSFYRDLGEKDVFETLTMAKQIFNINEDRIYLTGFSMGGSGTFDLGLKYPYLWAACAPVCGKLKNPLLVKNGSNLPFWIQAGSKDIVVPATYSSVIYELGMANGFTHWRYTEHKDMGHSFGVNWHEIENWLLEQSRKKHTDRIIYSGRFSDKIYWFEVLGMNDPDKSYHIEATVEGQKIHLKTENIESYKIHLEECPISEKTKILVFENGNQIDLKENSDIFVR